MPPSRDLQTIAFVSSSLDLDSSYYRGFASMPSDMAHSRTLLSVESLPSLQRQNLLSELAGLKQACPEGIFVSLAPGDPKLWSVVLFVRRGPYEEAIVRFQISFPDSFPRIPPLVTFSTDIFHPLISPLTTYMYTTDIQDNGMVSARDEERLPPGGFSLRHGFPQWFDRGRRGEPERRRAKGEQSHDSTSAQTSHVSSVASTPDPHRIGNFLGYMRTERDDISIYHVLNYIRRAFDDDELLDSVPLEAAGNPGAWHAWRTHRRLIGKLTEPEAVAPGDQDTKGDAEPAGQPIQASSSAMRRPGEWNWEGVWGDRVRKGIATSLSDCVLYGSYGPDEIIRFLALEESDVASIIDKIRRIFDDAT